MYILRLKPNIAMQLNHTITCKSKPRKNNLRLITNENQSKDTKNEKQLPQGDIPCNPQNVLSLLGFEPQTPLV